MSAAEIATTIIDKLQEENRVLLETLHKAQDTIKYNERQLADKNRVINVLEERVRCGTDGILEMHNRQKDLTIKHLEMQIQKLLKENEDLEIRLEAVKAEICPRCEAKLLLSENAGLSKSHRPPTKPSSALFDRKTSQTICPNRVKALERIIEHKDKRIMHLTKEIKRLTNLENELTQKIYRLTKLLPMSRLPPETITDCLLKEIHQLESQQQIGDCIPDPFMVDTLSKVNKPSTSGISTNKKDLYKSTERSKTSTFSKLKTSRLNLPESEVQDVLDATKFENEVLYNKLQKLSHDVNELKRLFAFEGEKLSEGLNRTVGTYNLFKINLKEIINNLNEIVQNIFTSVEKNELGHQFNDKYEFHLQGKLLETLNTVTHYENENKELKESIEKLKAQVTQQSGFSDYYKKTDEKQFKSFSDSACSYSTNDAKKLREIIKSQEAELEAAERHINSCQKFIEDLQRNRSHSTSDHLKIQHSPTRTEDKAVDDSFEKENKMLKTKLNVAEKNIKTCETVIEQLQKRVRELDEENTRIESELHELKSKAVSEEADKNDVCLSKFSQTLTREKYNQELEDKIKSLEETIKKLETERNSEESRQVLSETLSQEKMRLESRLDAADKQVDTLKKSIEYLQEELKTAQDEKNKFETQFKEVVQNNNLAEAYENDVMALKNKLILQEDENQELKETLHTLENKTLEMNHYRKSLHQEIENLCKALMENDDDDDDSERRKVIYRAAVLRSAQALLRLDDNYNLTSNDLDRSSALEEMTHQIQVYLTEVSRIHELLTKKEHERDELLKEYLDLEDDTVFKPSSPRQYESHVQGQAAGDGLESSNLKSPDFPSREALPKASTVDNVEFAVTLSELKKVQEELTATKSVTTYLLSSCTRLEDALSKEREERAKSERELEVYQETIKDLKAQLNSKNSMTKRLNTLIELMRSKEFNDEISLEQLKKEIQWLADKATSTESELCQYKEENCKMRNDLDSMKRELMNEKYEKAKTNSELKMLKTQILNSQMMLDETHVT